MTATSGNFKGSINSGSTITGSTITGGSINIHKGKYYLEMGIDTDHPKVSGLNVSGSGGGIAMNGAGISGFGGASSSNSYTLSSDGHITISPGGSLYLDNSLAGILVKDGEKPTSLSNLVVTKQGNGAQLGNLWVGDDVINADKDLHLNNGGTLYLNNSLTGIKLNGENNKTLKECIIELIKMYK